MKLPEIKCILVSVGESVKLSDKPDSGTKQTVLVKIPARKIDNDYGETKEIREEFYEMDVINNKVPDTVLKSLLNKKVVITTAYLNGYEYQKKDAVGKVTGEIAYGKSITLNALREFK